MTPGYLIGSRRRPSADMTYGEAPAGLPNEDQPMSIGGAMGGERLQRATDEYTDFVRNAPQEPKIGLGRKIAGALITGASALAGPGVLAGQTIGRKVAFGDYPEKLAQFDAEKKRRSEELAMLQKAEEARRKAAHDEESIGLMRQTREMQAEDRKRNDDRASTAAAHEAYNRRMASIRMGDTPYTGPATTEGDTTAVPNAPAELDIPGQAPPDGQQGPPPPPTKIATVPIRGMKTSATAVEPPPPNLGPKDPTTGEQYVVRLSPGPGMEEVPVAELDRIEKEKNIKIPRGRQLTPNTVEVSKVMLDKVVAPKERNLVNRQMRNGITGDVTTVWYDPTTGEEVKRDVDKGVAPSRPPATGVGAPTNPEGTPAIVFKQGTNEFKLAQDIAYGKLTWGQFRSMMAYNRDLNKKAGIYNTASELNPNFNPAAFEMGHTLAKNPKVQQQLASMDNVERGVEDLLHASEAASRSGVTTLNKFIVKGGIAIGGKKYSDFKTAQIGFADELSGALGFGSATDMSRQMGIDMTNESLSPEAFKSAIQNVVVPFIKRKRGTLLNQMGIYGTSEFNPAARLGGENPQPQGGRTQAPTVKTKAEYDALPSGAEYLEDGKKFRKP